jgi:hypothetical protein
MVNIVTVTACDCSCINPAETCPESQMLAPAPPVPTRHILFMPPLVFVV